jgi:hypothetical protein
MRLLTGTGNAVRRLERGQPISDVAGATHSSRRSASNVASNVDGTSQSAARLPHGSMPASTGISAADQPRQTVRVAPPAAARVTPSLVAIPACAGSSKESTPTASLAPKNRRSEWIGSTSSVDSWRRRADDLRPAANDRWWAAMGTGFVTPCRRRAGSPDTATRLTRIYKDGKTDGCRRVLTDERG